jgi:hypothetical protein
MAYSKAKLKSSGDTASASHDSLSSMELVSYIVGHLCCWLAVCAEFAT